MKAPNFIYILALVQFIFSSCKKEQSTPGTSSLTLINAVVGSSALISNYGNTDSLTYYAGAQTLYYGSYSSSTNIVSSYSGLVSLSLYQSTDTTKKSNPLYHLDLNLPVGTIHTLFLTGTVSAPDTLFTTDTPPYHPPGDSSVGIRFVNLSPLSSPISINIKNNSATPEIASLSYKRITDFKSYAATSKISSYVFEFRNAASGTLLASYTLSNINAATSLVRFRNVTIAVKGIGDGSGPMGTFLINNY